MRAIFLLLLLSPALLAEPIRIVTSVEPLKTFAEKIGGDLVEVTSLVRPGYNPHTYDLSAQQIMGLSNADLYIRTGVPFESAWMERIHSANPSMMMVDAREGLALLMLQSHEHEHHHHHQNEKNKGSLVAGETDPHIWTDPVRARQMAQNIMQAMVQFSPSNENTFKANLAEFIREIEQLDSDIRASLSMSDNRKFLVFHPAWGYFADRYGLEQVAIEYQGKEPGAKAVARIISMAQKEGIRVIFVQPQFDQRLARQIADSIEGQVIVVDPLSSNYINNMRAVARQFGKAMH